MSEKHKSPNEIDLPPVKGYRRGSKYLNEEDIIKKHNFLLPTYENNATRFKVIHKRAEIKKLSII